MTLENLLKEIETMKVLANQDPANFNPRSRPGLEMQVRQSKDTLASLKEQYSKELLDNSIGIFVSGTSESVQKFSVVAEKEGNTLTLDANELYEKLANEIEPSIGNSREFTSNQAMFLLGSLKGISKELGVTEMQAPKLHEIRVVRTHQDLVSYVRTVLREAAGDELNKLYLSNALTKKALKICYSGSVVPVVIVNAQQDEVNPLSKLFQKGAFNIPIDLEATIDKEYVLKTFQQTKKKLKQNKENNNE